MPELPEVEITARRLDAALRGAEVESALAPGMVVLKSIDPPLSAVAGRRIAGVGRIGKMPVVEFVPVDGNGSPIAMLVHLMSAGRLQVFEGRASLRDRTARVLMRLGHRDQPRHLHPMLRDQRVVAGIGRSWVDEILWEAGLSPFRQGSDLDSDEVERLHDALHVLGDAIEHYQEVIGDVVPDKLPMPLRVHRRQGEPCPRCGATLAAVHFAEHVTTYCPDEQTGGRGLKDRRLSRLLK